jgi:hypothetical protein
MGCSIVHIHLQYKIAVMKKYIFFFILCQLFYTGIAMGQYTIMSSAPDMNDYKNGANDGQYVTDKWAYDKAWKDMQQFNAMGMEITNLVAMDNIRRSYTPKMNTLLQNHKVSFTPSFKFTRGDNVLIALNAKATNQYNNNQLFSIQVNTQLAFFAYYESTPTGGLEYHDLAAIAAYYLYKNYYYRQGQNVTPNTAILQKVYEQVRKLFLATPNIARMNNQQKQEFAETMLFRTSGSAEDHNAGAKNNPLKNKRALDNLKHIYGDKGIQLKITDAGIVFDPNIKVDASVNTGNTNITPTANKIKANPKMVYTGTGKSLLVREKEKSGLAGVELALLITRMAVAWDTYKNVMAKGIENFEDVAGAFTYLICINYLYYKQVQEIPPAHVEKVYNQMVNYLLEDGSFIKQNDTQKQLLTETIILEALASTEASKANDVDNLKRVCLQSLQKYLGNKAGRLIIDANGMNF